jgi:hypothetical protein
MSRALMLCHGCAIARQTAKRVFRLFKQSTWFGYALPLFETVSASIETLSKSEEQMHTNHNGASHAECETLWSGRPVVSFARQTANVFGFDAFCAANHRRVGCEVFYIRLVCAVCLCCELSAVRSCHQCGCSCLFVCAANQRRVGCEVFASLPLAAVVHGGVTCQCSMRQGCCVASTTTSCATVLGHGFVYLPLSGSILFKKHRQIMSHWPLFPSSA